MKLDEIKLYGEPRKHRVRVGRGAGSGLGKTSGRGTKGFKKRQGHKILQVREGASMSLYRHSPKRGFKHTIFDDTIIAINLSDLQSFFKDGETVNLATLREKGFKIPKSKRCIRIKLLGKTSEGQELPKNLKLELHQISATAREQIEKVQGSLKLIELVKHKKYEKKTKIRE